MAESYRTRLQKALAPCEDVFSTLPCELSARIISEMPPNSLARLALSSKALSVRVAVRVTEGELWAHWHVPLFKQACELRSLVCRRGSQGSPPVASKEARCNALLSLLAGLKAIEPRAHLIVRLQALGTDVSGWRYPWDHLVREVRALLREQLSQCVAACSVAMKPGQLTTFASAVTEATREWYWSPDPRAVYEKDQMRQAWCAMMSSAISTSVNRRDWTPRLALALADCYDRSAEAPKMDLANAASLAALLAAIPLSLYTTQQHAHASDPETAAVVMFAYSDQSWRRLHGDEEGEFEYYEDDYEMTQCLEDRGKLHLKVTREVAPPVAVAVQLLHLLVMEDEERHSRIEENREYGNGWDGDYTRFVGTRTFLAGWASVLDFARLPCHEAEALATGLASFKDSGVKACLVPLALEWIKVLVDPFKQPVARSSKKCAELATTVQRVQRVCEVMLAGSNTLHEP